MSVQERGKVRIISDGHPGNTHVLVDGPEGHVLELQCVTGIWWELSTMDRLANVILHVIDVDVELGGQLADMIVVGRFRPPTRLGRLRHRLVRARAEHWHKRRQRAERRLRRKGARRMRRLRGAKR